MCKSGGFKYFLYLRFIVFFLKDYLGNNLYWCDSERQTVEVYNFNTKSRKVILYDLGGEIPQSIALVPEEGYVPQFVTVASF